MELNSLVVYGMDSRIANAGVRAAYPSSTGQFLSYTGMEALDLTSSLICRFFQLQQAYKPPQKQAKHAAIYIDAHFKLLFDLGSFT